MIAKPAVSIALVSLVLVGCSSYSARELPALDRVRFSSRAEREGIGVSAEAYTDLERQQTYLDADLGSIGAIPMLVLVENTGKQSRKLSWGKIRLHTPNSKFEELAGGDVAFRLDTSPGSHSSLDAALIGRIARALVGLSQARSKPKRQQARADDYKRKALPRGVINPGETRYGFVYFLLPDKTATFTDASLLLSLTDKSGENAVEVAVPIKVPHFPSFSARNS